MSRRIVALALCLALTALTLCACGRSDEGPAPTAAVTATPTVAAASADALPAENEPSVSVMGVEPAAVYRQVSTTRREVSLVLEGFTSAETMDALFALLKSRGVTCVFFLTGATAADAPEFAKSVIASGLELGNYGLNEKKELQKNSVDKNYHQIFRAQELLTAAAGVAPRFLRCNGTTLTNDLLRVVTLVGLQGVVEPTAYLNHRSFSSAEDALGYVQRLVRGSIISVKLGQELDLAEYPDRGDELNERPAIDKQPGLADEDEDELETGVWSYGKVLDVLGWLLDALAAEDYDLVLPDELHAMPIYAQSKTLTEEEAAVYDAASDEGSVTAEPFGVAQSSLAATTAAFSGTAFVGDGATAVLEDYVEWRRASDPSYFEGAQFLCASGLSVSGALQQVTVASKHPLYNGVPTSLESAIAQMGVNRVYLMLGVGDMKNFTAAQYIANLKILLYSIQQSAPGVSFCIQSMPPGIAGRVGTPTNSRIFSFNLALAKFCAESDIPFIDVAYALRDEKGDLPETLCADVSTYGTTLNDRGCEQWIDYLLTHLPS